MSLDNLLEIFSQAPPTQIDPEITPRFKELKGKNPSVVAIELKKIRDECTERSLASEFAILALGDAIIICECESKEEP